MGRFEIRIAMDLILVHREIGNIKKKEMI